MVTQSFKDLIVWQKARDLAVKMYKVTEQFPKSETYGLVSQMRRCVISISSNIAESYHRYHTKDKQRFLSIAFGSGSELESQIEIAKILYGTVDFQGAEKDIVEIQKILNKFLTK